MVTVFIIIKKIKKKLCNTEFTSCTLLVACIAFEVGLGWSKWILLVDQETRKQGRFLVANCPGLCMVVTAMVGSQSSCP